jgi:hypothetical protein
MGQPNGRKPRERRPIAFGRPRLNVQDPERDIREEVHVTSGRVAALASISLAAMAMPVFAADVTFERLLNAPNDPANWLMVPATTIIRATRR